MGWNFDITPTLALAQKNALTPFTDFIQGQQAGAQSAIQQSQVAQIQRDNQARQYAGAAAAGDPGALAKVAALSPDMATRLSPLQQGAMDRIGSILYAGKQGGPDAWKNAVMQASQMTGSPPDPQELDYSNADAVIAKHQTLSQQIEAKQRQQAFDLQSATLANTVSNQNRNFDLEKYKAAVEAWNGAGGTLSGQPMPQLESFMAPQAGGGDATLKSAQDSIAKIESGGNYQAVGPAITKQDGTTDRALGKYQVMASNLPQWSQEALGRQVSPGEFLSNPQIQDAIFNHQFGGLLTKYNPADAASVWFTGKPLGQGGADAADANGTTGRLYAQKFMQNFQPGQGAPAGANPAPQVPTQRPTVQIDPQTGQPDPKSQADYLASVPPNVAPLLKAAANYQLDPNKVFSLKGQQRALFDSMMQEYTGGTYDAQRYPLQFAMQKSVNNGQYGQVLNSADKVIQHMALLKDYADALNNGDVQAINAVKNRVAAEFGQAAATNFNVLAQGVGTELAKAMKGTGTVDVGSIDEAQKAFGTALSPQQITGALQTGMHMLASAVDPIAFRYKEVMGKELNWATPRTQAAMQKLGLNASEFGGAPAQATAGGFTPVGQPVKIGNSTIQEIN